MKDIDFFDFFIGLAFSILALGVVLVPAIEVFSGTKSNDYINQLEQTQIEQAEEKEVYVNKCKMYEDILETNGLIDECECR